jgi:hypothetical protein
VCCVLCAVSPIVDILWDGIGEETGRCYLSLKIAENINLNFFSQTLPYYILGSVGVSEAV